MPEDQSLKRGTNDSMLNNKQQLLDIIEELERDNLVMYAPEDGNVILIWLFLLYVVNLTKT